MRGNTTSQAYVNKVIAALSGAGTFESIGILRLCQKEILGNYINSLEAAPVMTKGIITPQVKRAGAKKTWSRRPKTNAVVTKGAKTTPKRGRPFKATNDNIAALNH